MKEAISSSQLRHMLKQITRPARRHRCPDCQRIFECHICTIAVGHPLHSDLCNIPFLCENCAQECRLDTVAVEGNGDTPSVNGLSIYDYLNGECVGRYVHVHGKSRGVANGLWQWNAKLYTGANRKWLRFDTVVGTPRNKRDGYK